MFDFSKATCFDWITPALGFARDVLEGPHYMFVVPKADAARAHAALKAGHHDAWHCGFVPFRGVYVFTVRADAAARLQTELLAAGVDVLNTREPPRNKAQEQPPERGVFGVFDW